MNVEFELGKLIAAMTTSYATKIEELTAAHAEAVYRLKILLNASLVMPTGDRGELVARLRVGVTHDTRDDLEASSCYNLETAADDAADMLEADGKLLAVAKLALDALESIPEDLEGYLPESCTDAVIALHSVIDKVGENVK